MDNLKTLEKNCPKCNDEIKVSLKRFAFEGRNHIGVEIAVHCQCCGELINFLIPYIYK